jgi:hypothetical protein
MSLEQDISGMFPMKIYENSPIKKWIKMIPMNRAIRLEDYNRKEYFKKVADIVVDDEVSMGGKKKRNTVIRFQPVGLSSEEYKEKKEWLYLFLINDRIVKIGGTRSGLKGRIDSYLCGHHIPERNKSGDCSKTNGFIYNTFDFYLTLGSKIEMYGYELPKTTVNIDIFDKEIEVVAQTYHAYESSFLGDFKKNYKEYPLLSDNCDPEYSG